MCIRDRFQPGIGVGRGFRVDAGQCQRVGLLVEPLQIGALQRGGVGPVAYTHLDVYKRQRQTCAVMAGAYADLYAQLRDARCAFSGEAKPA